MKGFVFERQMNAYIRHTAAGADVIYGDCFRQEGDAVDGIGNNVTITWNDMDFGEERDVLLEIEGFTKLPVNTINIRIKNDQGEEGVYAADFIGQKKGTQLFGFRVPTGKCSVSFVFLPGSSFDFRAFRFHKAESWTDTTE